VYFAGGKQIGGDYSDNEGKTYLSFSETTDSIQVSCMGFVTKTLFPTNLDSVILLSPKTNILNEILISPNESTSSKYGFVGIEKGKSVQSYSGFDGHQMVTKIENSYGKEINIHSLNLIVYKSKTDKDSKAKIIFFVNQNGSPGAQLPNEKVITCNELKGSKIEINLSSANLTLPLEGLFVGVEWMGCVDSQEFTANRSDKVRCKMAIAINELDDMKLLDNTFVRNVFYSEVWTDFNETMRGDMSIVPVIGLTVVE
jgi:hypothetical protein